MNKTFLVISFVFILICLIISPTSIVYAVDMDIDDEIGSGNTSNTSTNTSNSGNTSNSSTNTGSSQTSNTSSSSSVSTRTVTESLPESELGLSNILCIILIAIGVLLILLAIAILIRLGK